MKESDFLIDEAGVDPGHRHFSAMHWLYPNKYHTVSDSNIASALSKAGKESLDFKRLHEGGHTVSSFLSVRTA